MHRRVWVLFAAFSLPLGGASDAALDRATLRGLKAVNVVIDPVSPEIQKDGATTDQIRTRLEERLRDAGIKMDTASKEFVAFRLTSVRAARGPVAVAATIALYQPVTLVRDSNVKTSTQTWEVGTVLLADTKQLPSACLDSVDELAARFVSAYRTVNATGSDRAK